MTKQLLALVIAATFGIAHAADVKPAEPVAAESAVKAEVNTPAAKPVAKKVKKAKTAVPAAAPEAAKADSAPVVEPAKK
ncbi:hypothetical protein [Dechloromonas denitrificans]|uniref:hypothetical protein n=1 Tax=Dechloromonas denitrificans TaxID=281362 RepID=UPI001CFA4F17|nr:hypothetical protein [Dechloromonas denitrificans]UCV07681.1 hypothetical protein KI615_20250 [Dechloromonas denitrificans]